MSETTDRASVNNPGHFWSGVCPTEFTSSRSADALQLAILKNVMNIRSRGNWNGNLLDSQAVAAIPNYLGHRVNTFA